LDNIEEVATVWREAATLDDGTNDPIVRSAWRLMKSDKMDFAPREKESYNSECLLMDELSNLDLL
jgi:hypothetical protein